MAPIKKQIVAEIKLQILSGQATPAPPVGPALGQRGLNIMEFCKAFNAATQGMQSGIPVPVLISAYADRSFTFKTSKPPVSYYLKQAAGVEKGAKSPGREKTMSYVTRSQLRVIAETKMSDLSAGSLEAAERTIEGSARSMGLHVVEDS